MNEEQLFMAIGAADDALLRRSESGTVNRKPSKRWVKAGAAAACLALLATAALYLPGSGPDDPNSISPGPAQSVVSQTGASVGSFHLFAVCYAAGLPENAAPPDFALYYNDSIYASRQDGAVFSLVPLDAPPASLPECKLQITHRPGVAPEEAAAQLRTELSASYDTVSDSAQWPLSGGASLHAGNGTDWDAAQLDAWFADDLQGGSFVLVSTYFTEATEGHGLRFADIANTFRVSNAAALDASPLWVASLYETTEAVMDAFFADAPRKAAALLASGASFDTYGRDVRDELSIAGLNYTVDNDETPSTAIVSVAHRLDLEDSMTYLTMELTYQDGSWQVAWAMLEK